MKGLNLIDVIGTCGLIAITMALIYFDKSGAWFPIAILGIVTIFNKE